MTSTTVTVPRCGLCHHPLRNHATSGCSRCGCAWSDGDLSDARTPTNHRLAMIEVAERTFNRQTTSPGMNYARRAASDEKKTARRKLIHLWNRKNWPKGLSILTMPSVDWDFEWALLNSRESRTVLRGERVSKRRDFIHLATRNTYITAVEREPNVYLAALRRIPGGALGIAQVDAAPFASRSLKTPLIPRFHLATVERLMLMDDHGFDAAWLDFNGPLTDARVEAIRRFWGLGFIRTHLAVTVLAARQTMADLDASQVVQYLRGICPRSETIDIFHYQSGRSPMTQVVIGRTRSVPSSRSFKRAQVGEDAYCDLLDTIDPGDDEQ